MSQFNTVKYARENPVGAGHLLDRLQAENDEQQATIERLEDIARMENGMRERADATIEEAMKLKQMVLDDMSPPALRIQARKI